MRAQSQFIFFIVAILLLILVEVSFSSSSDLHNIDEWSSKGLSTSTGINPGLWFGPRMGRRLKRNLKSNSAGSYNNKDQLNYITDLLQGEPWSIIARNEGKRQMNLTPRLARESDEETGDRWLQENDVSMDSGDVMARSPPFAPRLGRRMWAQFI
uniref:Pyrokinin n=1 Tax=Carabus violaceus TaxID=41075 RepID=A0A7U3RBL9_CARVO|nr:pyrokinin [Carabus violaceus]